MESTCPPKRKRAVEDDVVDLTCDNEDESSSPARQARIKASLSSTPARHNIAIPVHARSPSATTTPAPAATPIPAPTATPTPASTTVTQPSRTGSASMTSTTPARPDTGPNEQTPIHRLPQLADRYVPRPSTAEGVECSNPHKFSLKPAYWVRWRPREYSIFAELLTSQFDPLPLAQTLNKPVEEITHMFYAIVRDPLYNAKRACRRGEKGMHQIIHHYLEHSTEMRVWTELGEKVKGRDEREEKKFKGELSGVGEGKVEVIREVGIKDVLSIEDLSNSDIEYLKKTLDKDDKRTLFS